MVTLASCCKPIKNDEISHIPEENQPKSCISCRVCEGLCPQNIEISDIMTKFINLNICFAETKVSSQQKNDRF